MFTVAAVFAGMLRRALVLDFRVCEFFVFGTFSHSRNLRAFMPFAVLRGNSKARPAPYCGLRGLCALENYVATIILPPTLVAVTPLV